MSVEDLVPTRLRELVGAKTPWHRSLWQAGTVLALREVLEYADGVRAGAMNAEGLTFVCSNAKEQVERDVGVGPEGTRSAISAILNTGHDKQKGLIQAHVADSLLQLIRRAEHGYLRRWADAVRAGVVQLEDAELLARLAAAHLLDAGFAADHVYGWLDAKADEPLADLLDLADEMCTEEAREFQVLVPFQSLPGEVAQAAGGRFRTAEDTEAFLAGRGLEKPPGRRGAGSLVFQVVAREPWSAVAAADIDVRRLAARAVVGLTSKTVSPVGWAMVLDSLHGKWRPLKSRQQKDVLVTGIARHGLLIPETRTADTRDLDDAFELLAAVDTSTSWASVAAIWAAVEGLLARATEKGTLSADRMAAVVAAGYIRAELTDLATHITKLEGAIPEDLRDESQSFGIRLDHLFEAIATKQPLPTLTPEDEAAVLRMQSVVDNPEVLRRLEGYLKSAFRRLYQQRNLLLHGGRFDSVALPMTMRSVPILVAAGLDRLVYAVSDGRDGVSPLGLAARAQNELAMIGGDGARQLHRLLD